MAGALKLPRFGERTIREVEAGERPLYEHEAEAIASACKIDPAFFTVDLGSLALVRSDALDGPGAVAAPATYADVERLMSQVSSMRRLLEAFLMSQPAARRLVDRDASLREEDRLREEELSDEGQARPGARR